MIDMRISFSVVRCGLLCLLAGALSWGQAVNSGPAVPEAGPTVTAAPTSSTVLQSQRGEMRDVAADVPVITITGLCDHRTTNNTADFQL